MDQPRSRLLHIAAASALGAGLALTGAVAATSAAQAAKKPPAQAPAGQFRQVTLAKGAAQMGEPQTLAVLPDGSVLHDSRGGTIYYTKDNQTTVAGQLSVYNHDEEGLQGMAIGPQFAHDHWVYMYYGPPLNTPAGDAPENGTAADFAPWKGYNQLSRFKFEDGKIDVSSEQKILRVDVDRGICCHVGGNIDFDNAGNLYLSTGDDSNPFESDGYAPIDQRSTRNPAFDAERSAGNTNDLRGKLLRIHPNKKDGGYSIPHGNLFPQHPGKPGHGKKGPAKPGHGKPEGTSKTRPEIYAMGFRNPYRFSVDRKTGTVYLANYGPDAQTANPNRGPENTVEYDHISKAGNYGWPFCIGANTPYRQYDFATGVSGPPFDCAHPKNTSPNNTGLTDLPPAQPAWISNHYAGNPLFPQLGGQGAPMGGPVYNYNPHLKSDVKFPQSYDGKFFAMDFGAHWIKPITSDKNFNIQSIDTLTNGSDWASLVAPFDAEFGPDGSLYVLDYGSTWYAGSPTSAVYKMEFVPDSTSSSSGSSAGKG